MPNQPLAPAPEHERFHAVEEEFGDFCYIVSHDLVESMRHLTEFSGLLVREMGDRLTPPQQAHAEHVRRASEKCQAMMEQLLAYSRAQQRDLALSPVDLTHLMEIAQLQLSAEVRAAEGVVQIEPLGWLEVHQELLTIAFKHVLANSLKFRRSDVPARIQVHALSNDRAIVIRISDNGFGVAADRQEKLFRMFYQDQPEGAFPGVGAGLAIARRIVRRHGGDMRFVAQSDGACVEIMLPRDGA